MIRGSTLNLLGTVCSQIALLLVTIIVARKLGRVGIGAYAQAYAVFALLVPLSFGGLAPALTRFIAVGLAEGDLGWVRGTVHLGLTIMTAVAVLLGGALFLAAPWLVEEVFHNPALVTAIRFSAMTVPLAAFTGAALAVTQGYRRMRSYALINLVVQPLTQLVLTALLLLLHTGLRGVMTALVASYVVAAVLAAFALRRVAGPLTARPTYRTRELLRFSVVLWMASLATTGLIWADTILLGIFRTTGEVGVYNVATRLVALATFVMGPITTAFAPRIAHLHHRRRMSTLQHTYRAATGWIVRLSLPAFVVLLALPRELLGYLGKGFAVGATVTMVLAAGKLVDAATGPCAMVLNMAGRPAVNMLDNVAVLVGNIVLNLVLIPRYGIVGAAIAWAISLSAVNLARVGQVWFLLGMLPFSRGVLKAFCAAAAAYVVGVLLVRSLPSGLAAPLALVAIGLTYLGLILLQGVDPDDRLVLTSFGPRVARLSALLGPSGRTAGRSG
jgi:O-antigen/teichoic acid export membrane protein